MYTFLLPLNLSLFKISTLAIYFSSCPFLLFLLHSSLLLPSFIQSKQSCRSSPFPCLFIICSILLMLPYDLHPMDFSLKYFILFFYFLHLFFLIIHPPLFFLLPHLPLLSSCSKYFCLEYTQIYMFHFVNLDAILKVQI